MKKSFYSTFGTNRSSAEVAEDLGKFLDLEFKLHESSYLGEYYKYSGLYADKITIENNKPHMDRKNPERLKNHATLIFVSNENGKNADKFSKNNYLKAQLSKVADITLLEEYVHEE